MVLPPTKYSLTIYIIISIFDNFLLAYICSYPPQIDEDAEIRITKKELLSLYEYGFYDGYLLKVNANVTESLTGIVQSGFGVLTYYEKPIKVTALPGNPAQFKPGLMYTAYVSIFHLFMMATKSIQCRNGALGERD